MDWHMMIEHERGCKCDDQREHRDAAPVVWLMPL
jgi:hypothetical protein